MRTIDGQKQYDRDVSKYIILETLPNGWWMVGFDDGSTPQHVNHKGLNISEQEYLVKKRELILEKL